MFAPLLLFALLPLADAADGKSAPPLPPPDYALNAADAEGVWLGAQSGAGLVGRDGVLGVGVGVGVQTRPFALHLRAPVALRVLDAPPLVGAAGSQPPACVVVRCEEWTRGGALSPDALSRIVDEVRLFERGDVFHLRGGALFATLGHGQLVSRYTNAADWDRRRSGLYVESQLPWRGLHLEAIAGGVLSPQELFALRADFRPVGEQNEDGLTRLLGRMRVGLELAGDATAPVGEATDARGDVKPGSASRPLVGTALDVTWPLFDGGGVQLAPWVSGSLLTGLADDDGEAGVGVGVSTGIDVTLELAAVALRAGAQLNVDGARHRTALFSTLYDVDRRRFLGPRGAASSGVAELRAPGGIGGGGTLEAIVLDVVRAGARVHVDPVWAATETELFGEVGVGPVRVGARALQRADTSTGDLVPLAAPLFLVAEGAWAVWAPFSVVGRWLRTPRFHPARAASAPALVAIDDDVFVGVSVDVVLSGS